MRVERHYKMSQTLRISVEPLSRDSKKSGKNTLRTRPKFASPPHNKRLDISAATVHFPTQIQPKNHLLERYRTHRCLSISMPPFSRLLASAISRQRNALNQRQRIRKMRVEETYEMSQTLWI